VALRSLVNYLAAGPGSLCVVCAAFFLISCTNPKTEVAKSDQAPAIEIKDIATGQKVAMEQFKGKVLFINFWASWCPPCKEEMPSLEALYRELRSDGRFAMLTILYNDDPKNAVDYMMANGYTFPVFADHDGISAKRYNVTGVPETYVIDKKGTLRKRVIGAADWYSPEAKAYLNALLLE
jgi:thiol-disulfide isomerase/thioredoxin